MNTFQLKALFTATVLLLLGCEIVLALDPDRAISQYSYEVWQTSNGLPHNTVRDIKQTRDGYLWLATPLGLVRFDGVSFVMFNKANTKEMMGNRVASLTETRDGSLWICQLGGLTRLKEGKFTAYTMKDGLPINDITKVSEDVEGNLWIGTAGGGLSKYKDGRFTNYTTKDGLTDNYVSLIVFDRQGRLFVGTQNGGLSLFKDDRFVSVKTQKEFTNRLAFCEDRNGNLWLGAGKVLSRLKDGHVDSDSGEVTLPATINTLYEDHHGNLWIGTSGGGVYRYHGNQLSSSSHPHLFPHIEISAISEDREGNLWLGIEGGGLVKLQDGKFVVYSTLEGLNYKVARGVIEDHQGNIWIGTKQGLNLFRDGKFKTYRATNKARTLGVTALNVDYEGTLLVGMEGGWIYQFKDEKLAPVARVNNRGDVNSLYRDRHGTLWLGTRSGLQSFSDGKIFHYVTDSELRDPTIKVIHEDRLGGLWLATKTGLKQIKDGKVVKSYTTKDGLAHDTIISIYEDVWGSLWLGTRGGLSRFKGDKFSTYTSKNGLVSDDIFQVLEDDQNNLWMSSDARVFRVNKQDLEKFDKGEIKTIPTVAYGTADGMRSSESSGPFVPAGWRSRDGRMWFATKDGVAVIDPNNIKLNSLPPAVYLEKVIVDRKTMDGNHSISLLPERGDLEFHYTGLSFQAPEKARFKYKLEGFDKDWIDAGARRVAYYTNLPPGDYKFRVIASNNDGLWNEEGASLTLYLKPHFYQTYWFYAFCAAFALLIIWRLYHYRVGQMRRQYAAVLAERNRIARELHDTLEQSLAGIALQVDAATTTLSESPEAAKQHLALTSSLLRYSQKEARRSVWDLRSQALEQGDLATALYAVIAHQLTNGAVIQMHIEGTPRRLSGVIENNILRIGQEAITNAVKHSHARHVDVKLKFDAGLVRLCVEDDGAGFDANKAFSAEHGHFGLLGMSERAEQLGANFSLRSRPGKGTEVVVSVPDVWM